MTDFGLLTSDSRHQEVTQIAISPQNAGKQGSFVISGRNSGEIESGFHYKLCKTKPISAKTRMNISTAITKSYAKEQRTNDNEQSFKTNPNKPHFKIGKMNTTFFRQKPYANEQRTMDNEHDSKQTQSKPNSPTAKGTRQNSEVRTPRPDDDGRLVLRPSSSLPG